MKSMLFRSHVHDNVPIRTRSRFEARPPGARGHSGLPRLPQWTPRTPAFGIPRTPAGPVEAHHGDQEGALMDLAQGAVLAHCQAHGGIRKPMLGRIVAGRSVELFGS